MSPSAINRSTASDENGPAAPGSLVSAHSIFGAVLAPALAAAAPGASWPTTLSGVTVTVRDAAGASHPAPLHRVSPSRVDYQVPATAAPGFALATIAHGSVKYATNLNILNTYLHLSQADGAAVTCAARAKSLCLLGSGLGDAKEVTASVGGTRVPVEVKAAGQGQQEYHVTLPNSQAGKGKKVEVVITAGGRASNAVNVTIK